MSIICIIYMIAHMGWIGLGQNFRKKELDWIVLGPKLIGLDWIGLGWIKKIGPMSNSGLADSQKQSSA